MKKIISLLLEQVNFAASADLDPTYKDAENYWFSKGLTIVGFLVNNTLAAELEMDIPTSWADLLDEQYAGEIIMSNPAISGTNYGVVNCLLQVMGEEEGWKYFEALNENIAYYGRRGWITYRLLGISWNPYNCWGVIWMQSISFVPMNALFLSGILTKMDTASIHAARDFPGFLCSPSTASLGL